MKRLICLFLSAALLFSSAASAVTTTPFVLESMFLNIRYKQFTWEFSEQYSNGEQTLIDETDIKGRRYTFRVAGIPDRITEISLSGWFRDLGMSEPGFFPDGWFVYSSFHDAMCSFIPDGDVVDKLIHPYDIHYSLSHGWLDTSEDMKSWSVESIARNRIELVCSAGGRISLSADNAGYFHVAYTLQ